MKAVKKDFNFLPTPLLEQRQRRQRILRLSPLVLAAVLLIAGAFYAPVYLAAKCQAEIDQIKEKYSYLTPAVPYYNKAIELETGYNESRRAIVEIEKMSVPLAEIIDGISSVMPPEVRVTRLSVDSTQGVTLTFETDSALRTAQFIVGLRTLPFFGVIEPKQVPLHKLTDEVVLEMPFRGMRPQANPENKQRD
ncbi:MAG: hypothetical protein ACM3UW_04015 [Bacillota bacterium]